MKLRQAFSIQSPVFGFVMGALLFGSLWGVLEATLGGVLHLLHLPFKGQVMANIGFFIMAVAVAASRRPLMPLAVGLVAASFKATDALLLSVPLAERMIVNPMIAIVLEALAFQALFLAVTKKQKAAAGLRAYAVRGAAGMYLATVMSALVFFFVLRRGPWDIGRLDLLARYLTVDGSVAAIVAAAVVPLGAYAGERLRLRGAGAARSRPGLLYGGAVMGVACCWAGSALYTLLVAAGSAFP